MLLDEIEKARQTFNFDLWAYVIMPNHVHLLIWPKEKSYEIAEIQRCIKGRTSHSYSEWLIGNNPGQYETFLVNDRGKKQYRFWQRGGGFDRNLWNNRPIYDSIMYIENNPVRKGLIGKASEWEWSSAFTGYRGAYRRPVVNRSSVPVAMKWKILRWSAGHTGREGVTQGTRAIIQTILRKKETSGALVGRQIAFKAGCLVIEEAGTNIVTEGIYLFVDKVMFPGLPYVGQSVNIETRLEQHVGKRINEVGEVLGRLSVSGVDKAEAKTTRDLLEQWVLDILRKKGPVSNIRNVIGEGRQSLRETLKGVKLCR
jgi:putative transposase